MAENETKTHVLVVDDDPAVGMVLGALLQQAGYRATSVQSAARAVELLSTEPIDAVITDLRMPGMDGMQLLAHVVRALPDVPVLVISAHASIPDAVEAMKVGAADFVQKPFDREEILFSLKKALAGALKARAAPPPPAEAPALVGQSREMADCLALLARAAKSSATVLLRGESGTGKDLAAREIHRQSARKSGPFVKVHCGALPDNLLESELFGYEKGAFTGASTRKPGRVEIAEGGTLFLDEIGDITPSMQVKLLRVLQEREFERLGGTQTLKADVRFIAATHRDLEAMIAKGEFREDLFYRLNVVPVWMPSLRSRPGDIPVLAKHLAEVIAAQHRHEVTLDDGALTALSAENWPGNVRQLQNFIERLVVLSDGTVVTAADVARELGRRPLSESGTSAAPAPVSAQSPDDATARASTPASAPTLDDRRRVAEKDAIVTALQQAGNNRTLAARLLGISRRTLYTKLEELGIR
ncbi:MAG: sigma-54-dependent Fis family transcriptional regulator [Polyangiaceae bacterium]|nr:sigma-54-dependent Fis family transcriptional regulator [Polyangiaceae bacterium]